MSADAPAYLLITNPHSDPVLDVGILVHEGTMNPFYALGEKGDDNGRSALPCEYTPIEADEFDRLKHIVGLRELEITGSDTVGHIVTRTVYWMRYKDALPDADPRG